MKFRFQQVTALGVYEGRLREVVLRMKRPPGELLSLAMGELLAERLRERVSQEPVDWVAAMPMHWRRRWVRTVNPPELLAERVSRRLGLTTRRVLYFRRNIQQQSTLAPSLRQRNVRGALGVFPGYDLADARVLLLDDILTTGATANEAARCLKRAGAKSVQVAVVARGVGID
ncbi:MAG: phosphoribosyltransferase family protein [Pirellulaceae bacterium]